MSLTNSQTVRKFGKMNSTRIAGYNSPSGKSEKKFTSSKKSKSRMSRKSCLKRMSRAEHQNSIVKEAASQSVFKRERKWKKLVAAHQQEPTNQWEPTNKRIPTNQQKPANQREPTNQRKGTNQRELTQAEKAKISSRKVSGSFLEYAIDEVMKEFQKITIQEAWQSWPEDEI